jgi:hypothetical protein
MHNPEEKKALKMSTWKEQVDFLTTILQNTNDEGKMGAYEEDEEDLEGDDD